MWECENDVAHPFCPALGTLLLNCLTSFCLNLGGAALEPPVVEFILETFDHKDRKMFFSSPVMRRRCAAPVTHTASCFQTLFILFMTLLICLLIINLYPYFTTLILFVSVLKPQATPCWWVRDQSVLVFWDEDHNLSFKSSYSSNLAAELSLEPGPLEWIYITEYEHLRWIIWLIKTVRIMTDMHRYTYKNLKIV